MKEFLKPNTVKLLITGIIISMFIVFGNIPFFYMIFIAPVYFGTAVIFTLFGCNPFDGCTTFGYIYFVVWSIYVYFLACILYLFLQKIKKNEDKVIEILNKSKTK